MSIEGHKTRARSARRFNRKSRVAASLCALICTGVIGAASAGYLYYDAYYSSGWHTHSGNTYYISPESGEKVTGMQLINNTTYIFDSEGNMLRGWQDYDGGRYYLDDSGVLQKGRVTLDGEEYYFADDSGLFRTGLQDFNGNEYFFDDHGFPGNGFEGDTANNRYYDSEGKLVTGWAEIRGARYYFKSNGDMATGPLEIDGITYYFGADGHLLTGKQRIDGREYDFGEKGAVLKGWRNEGGKFRYADENTGAFATGFREIDGKTYYFGENYYMVTGIQTIGDTKYKFGDDGVLTEGWEMDEDGNKSYYTRNGLAKGLVLIDDNYYSFDDNGILRTEWYTDPETGNTYYFGKDGIVHEGFLMDGDDVYYFDPITHVAVTGWIDLYEVPDDKKKQNETFAADCKLLDKYEKSMTDYTYALSDSEQTRLWNILYSYNTKNGQAARDAYRKLGDKMFGLMYFKPDHKMAQGPTEIDGFIFFFDEVTGLRKDGWCEYGGKKYYAGISGVCCTAEERIDGLYYDFNPDGSLRSGLIKDGDRLRYGESDGTKVDVWVKSDFRWDGEDIYYFDEEGYAVKGLNKIKNKYFFFGEDFKLVRGFVENEGDLYYMTGAGGAMEQWVSTGPNETYYFNDEAKAVTGWQRIKGVDYYFGKDHLMRKGWQTIDGLRYCLYKGGLLRGPQYVDGKRYVFSEDGSMRRGWVTWNNVRYYCYEPGIPVVDEEREIDGKLWSFSYVGAATEITS